MGKKKTKLKPVARGFATTSVPKKVVHTPVESDVDTPDGTKEIDVSDQTPALVDQDTSQLTQATSEEFDPDKVEEQSLQNLVDKLQGRTEKEISRTIRAIELDKIFSKKLPSVELDSESVSCVYDLSLLESPGGGKLIDEPEEKAISRLGITYGVLRRLGFHEDDVIECLSSIGGIDLDEALDWLFLHYVERVTTDTEDVNLSIVSRSVTPAPSTPRTPAAFSASDIWKTSTLDPNAVSFIPPSGVATSLQSRESMMVTSAIAAPPEQDCEKESVSDVELSDIDDPNVQYARVKMRQQDLMRKGRMMSPADTARLKKLEEQMRSIAAHYFFNRKDAEANWKSVKEEAATETLRARLRGDFSQPASNGDRISVVQDETRDTAENLQVQTPQRPRSPARSPSPVTPDIFDEEDAGDEAGVLGLLEEMPSTVTDSEGSTIIVRDMPLPKHWSGRTPKSLLADVVGKRDRYAVITYDIVSGSTRVKRAAVHVRWEGQRVDDWVMKDIACHDVIQAEQYIATVALHDLMFPSSQGFAAGNSVAPAVTTSFRSLPPVFRDLWVELDQSTNDQNNAINRSVWSKLRTVIEPKLTNNAKANEKIAKQNQEPPQLYQSRLSTRENNPVSQNLMDILRSRQNTLAYQEMLYHRNTLPIAQYRNEIISILETSQILVLSGETGCGKSTQVPAFILENQLSRGMHCKVYCTEPRRISAISLAQRVSRELGEPPSAVGTPSSIVGYSIRLESNTNKNTRLAYVTNGIALRMLEGGTGQGGSGTAFDEITHIVIDEVHERTIESDFLLIVLKSLLAQRPDLKIILMSATVDAEKVSAFFGGCPTLHVPGRTFPVDVRYLEDAIEHTRWFIAEKSPYARRRDDKFYRSKNQLDWSEDAAVADGEDEDAEVENIKLEKRYSSKTAATINLLDERLIPYDLIVRLLERICFEDATLHSYSSAVLVFMPGISEIRRLNDLLSDHRDFGQSNGFRIYPLHSTLSSEDQSAVFDVPPPGIRKIVISTNIAETGVTIPDVTCVIDSGKHREMRYDEKRQISRLVETYIAKSNAAQRRGRAGRVRNGLCFHLFTKVRHETRMADQPLPEILRLSLSDLALRIKIMKVNLGSTIEDVLTRAMDPPSSINIQRAVSALVEVGALTSTEEITPMGRLLSKLPTDVHLGKFLLIATLLRCLDPALTIAASLNSKSPFVTPFGLEHEADRAKNSFRVENSDFLTIHNAFASWRRASANSINVDQFCRKNFLSRQNLQQIEELRQQLLGYLIDSAFISVDKSVVRELNRARFVRHRTRFVPVPADFDYNSANPTVVSAALAAGLYPKILAFDRSNGQMKTVTNGKTAHFHPSSVNFGRKMADFGVNHLAYFTLMQSKRLYAWETGPVDDIAMILLCGDVEFKPISNTVVIDRRIKFQMSSQSIVALKYLRNNLASLLASQFRLKPLNETQNRWNELAMAVLGKVKTESAELDPSIGVNRVISQSLRR